jgi:hypothetical protein
LNIRILRRWYSDTTTSGQLFINDEYFCETLEDTARAYGVKIPRKTCIPAGKYQVKIDFSNRFQRYMALLYTNSTDLSCEHNGIRFTGVRIHGGNTHENTEGCVLAASKRHSIERISGTMEAPLLARIKNALDTGEKVVVDVINGRQEEYL